MLPPRLKYFLTFIFLFTITTNYAQSSSDSSPKINVESFTQEFNDPTANREGTKRIDQNGETCALIKIETTQHGFYFDTGSLGVKEVEEQNSEHPAEIWLYVPRGVKFLNIQHPRLGMIKYDLGRSLQKAQTYRMVLTTNEVNTTVIDPTKSETVTIEIYPPDASLYINYTPINKTHSGVYPLTLFHGVNTYRVTADNYYPEDGQIKISDTSKPGHISIRLKQAFGYLDIPATDDTKGAKVYVDGKQVGTVPLKSYPLGSGSHTVEIQQSLYKPFIKDIQIGDSAFVNISPLLIPNYAEVDFLISDPDVTIYDNGNPLKFMKGMTARLEDGRHIIEVKKPSHSSTTKTINVEAGRRQSVGLESPHPLYGYLSATSDPSGAIVLLNGHEEGITPIIKKRVLIGDYHISFSKTGYKEENKQITVKEEENTTVNATLNGFCTATLFTEPYSALIYIDGEYVGNSPYKFNHFTGDYKIEVKKEGYSSYSKTIALNAETSNFTIKLHRDFLKNSNFYIQAGYSVLGVNGMTFGLGGYIKNVNIEANYILGLSKSEVIYWNSTNGNATPLGTTYTPNGFDIKIGYGIGFAGRFRVTPQFGWQGIRLKENDTSEDYDAIAEGASAGSLSFGAKLDFIVINHLGLSVTPQYMLPVSLSEGYKRLKDVSSKIKGYSDGFGINLSVNAYF